MPATLTLTGTAGSAVTVSAVVFAGVTSFTIDPDKNMVYFVQAGVNKEVSVAAATTVTGTKSGSTWTLVIS